MTDEQTPPDEFDKTEKMASQLLDQLERLKEEVEKHKNAASSFEEVSSGIGNAADHLAAIAKQTGAVIEGLKSIGEPQIMESVKQLDRAAEETRVAFSEIPSLMARLNKVEQAVEESRVHLLDIPRLMARLTKMEQTAEETQKSLHDVPKLMTRLQKMEQAAEETQKKVAHLVTTEQLEAILTKTVSRPLNDLSAHVKNKKGFFL